MTSRLAGWEGSAVAAGVTEETGEAVTVAGIGVGEDVSVLEGCVVASDWLD